MNWFWLLLWDFNFDFNSFFRLMVYSGLDPERQVELGSTNVPAAVTTIKYHCDQVIFICFFVAREVENGRGTF